MPASDYVTDPEPPPVAEGADRNSANIGTAMLVMWLIAALLAAMGLFGGSAQ